MCLWSCVYDRLRFDFFFEEHEQRTKHSMIHPHKWIGGGWNVVVTWEWEYFSLCASMGSVESVGKQRMVLRLLGRMLAVVVIDIVIVLILVCSVVDAASVAAAVGIRLFFRVLF